MNEPILLTGKDVACIYRALHIARAQAKAALEEALKLRGKAPAVAYEDGADIVATVVEVLDSITQEMEEFILNCDDLTARLNAHREPAKAAAK